MPSFNKIILIGNLTRDPELSYTPSGTAVCAFGMATNRKWTDKTSGEQKEDVCFFDCSAFGKVAEVVQKFAAKGKPLFVEGRMAFEQWEDRQSGAKRSKLKVVAESVQLLGFKDDGGGQDGKPARSRPQQQQGAYGPRPGQGPPPENPIGDEQQFQDADIPF